MTKRRHTKSGSILPLIRGLRTSKDSLAEVECNDPDWNFKMAFNVKNLVLFFCLLQALVVSYIILTIILYNPEYFTDDVSDDITESVIVRKRVRQEEQVITKRIMSQHGHPFTVFRHDLIAKQPVPIDLSKMWIRRERRFNFSDNSGSSRDDAVEDWFLNRREFCDGSFVKHGNKVIRLKEAVIDPRYGIGKVGGDKLIDVMEQGEEEERFVARKGFFRLDNNCKDLGQFDIFGDFRLMMDGLLIKEEKTAFEKKKIVGTTAVVTIRHEYANFYHTTMNFYDVFLILVMFEITPENMDVIWMDAHPQSDLDEVWEILFRKPTRIGSIRERVEYPTMFWNVFGPHSHINQHRLEDLPYAEEYRHFVLSRFDVFDDHVRACGNLKITIIWRRDAVVHPRNPHGFTSRKVANEEEVWRAVKRAVPSGEVNGAQMDKLSMQEQLDLVARTDILVGMHGAGMSHVMYLPKTSGVIEMYPSYTSAGNAHFRSMSRWRRLPYITWYNLDRRLDDTSHKTNVPVDVVEDMVRTMKNILCPLDS